MSRQPLAMRSRGQMGVAVRAALLGTVMLAGCAGLDAGNPLIGRWNATAAALPGVSLGTYEFRRGSMTAMGVTQPVEYTVEDGLVRVVPAEGPGLALDVTLLDADTARVEMPVLGGVVTLRRLRSRGLF
ncbi:hypothetical protein [Arenibaculum pallidiluteum]|uniref:hypothetical protein n=1 Tax=Arenibaculum pallidiluteum TaxID=2812559 RepID=UPI001A978769|nr:hypothetical protein [Arenibaculum pallidiluteum]